MIKIAQLKSLYDGWSRLYLAKIAFPDGAEISREIEDHGAAATVLPYDPVRRCAFVVRQLRAGALYAGAADPLLIEAPAGLIDDGEQPVDAVRREAFEEVGLELKTVEPVHPYFAMPSVSSERIHLFLAEYAPADRTAEGGGLSSETESLEVLELPLSELWSMLETGRLQDLKTATLLLWLRTRRPELF